VQTVHDQMNIENDAQYVSQLGKFGC